MDLLGAALAWLAVTMVFRWLNGRLQRRLDRPLMEARRRLREARRRLVEARR